MPTQTMPQYKSEFLGWLNRFSRFPRHLRANFENLNFSEDELDKLRPMIEAKYKLKVAYLGRRRGA